VQDQAPLDRLGLGGPAAGPGRLDRLGIARLQRLVADELLQERDKFFRLISLLDRETGGNPAVGSEEKHADRASGQAAPVALAINAPQLRFVFLGRVG